MVSNKPNNESSGSEQLLIFKATEIPHGKWRLPIIILLGQSTLRYTELKDKLPLISDRGLACNLSALIALGVIQRNVCAEVPPRMDYA